MKFPGKFKTHWKRPYIVQEVTNGGAVQLAKLNGEIFPAMVNGSRLKKYRDSRDPLIKVTARRKPKYQEQLKWVLTIIKLFSETFGRLLKNYEVSKVCRGQS